MPTLHELHLPGTHLEGGGQLLRLALSLSTLTSQPLHLTSIRGNRPRSRASKGRGGGLKKSHVECVRFLAQACSAWTEGLSEGSDELRYWPESLGKKAPKKGNRGEGEEQWAATLTVEQDTPGAVYLIVQALLPYILFGPYSQPNTPQSEQKPVRLRITGGTNVSSSPSHDYATRVLFPMLRDFVGIPEIKTTLVRRGWSSDPGKAGMGEVVFEITPLAGRLRPFEIKGRGKVKRIQVASVASPVELGRQIAEKVWGALDEGVPAGEEVEREMVLEEDSGKKNRVHVLIVLEFEVEGEGAEGRRLRVGRDCLFDGKAGMKGEVVVETVARKLVRELKKEVGNGGAVDEYMQDQLVVFQALAEGVSEVERKEPSLHAQTARWVAEQLLKKTDMEFDEGTCNGIGFRPLGIDDRQGSGGKVSGVSTALPSGDELEPAKNQETNQSGH